MAIIRDPNEMEDFLRGLNMPKSSRPVQKKSTEKTSLVPVWLQDNIKMILLFLGIVIVGLAILFLGAFLLR